MDNDDDVHAHDDDADAYERALAGVGQMDHVPRFKDSDSAHVQHAKNNNNHRSNELVTGSHAHDAHEQGNDDDDDDDDENEDENDPAVRRKWKDRAYKVLDGMYVEIPNRDVDDGMTGREAVEHAYHVSRTFVCNQVPQLQQHMMHDDDFDRGQKYGDFERDGGIVLAKNKKGSKDRDDLDDFDQGQNHVDQGQNRDFDHGRLVDVDSEDSFDEDDELKPKRKERLGYYRYLRLRQLENDADPEDKRHEPVWMWVQGFEVYGTMIVSEAK
jgi:hypothetical protein